MKREKIHTMPSARRHWAIMDEKSFCPTCGATPGYNCMLTVNKPMLNSTVHASRVAVLSHNTRTY